MKRRTRILVAVSLFAALAADAEPLVPGSAAQPDAIDPTRPVDPRGLSHLPATGRSPRRSPAGWLYAFPREPLRTTPVVGPWDGALHLEWGAVFDDARERETRYERYSDRSDGILLHYAGLALRHRERPLSLRAGALAARREDQAYFADLEHAGLWRVRGSFSSLRRHYATDARSLLDGVGEGQQTLRGGLAAGGNSQAEILSAIAALRDETLAVTRDRTTLRLDLTPSPTLRLYSSYRFEDRDGARPFGGALGFPLPSPTGQWIESSEPVDAHTHEVAAGLEWAGNAAQLNLRYGVSLFDNRLDGLRFENPFDLGDPDIREGRFALSPSNRAHRVESDFAWSLPGRVQLGGGFAWSRHRQNESLLPPTVNSGLVGSGANPLELDLWNTRDALLRERADARIDRGIAHLYALWSPTPRLRLRARGRLEDHDDDTRYRTVNPSIGALGYVSEDGALEATTGFRRVFQAGVRATDDWRYRSIPTSHRTWEGELEGDLRLYGKTRVRATARRRSIERDHRAREHTRERTLGLALTSRDIGRLTLRLAVESASRSGSPYDLRRLDDRFVSSLAGYVGPLPGGQTPPYGLAQHRQRDLANRTRHHGRLRVHWLLRDDMDLAGVAEFTRENYRAAYGLRDRDSDQAHLQWSWRPRPALEAHLHYGFERRWTEMGLVDERFAVSEDPNAGGPWFPLDWSWAQRSRARIHQLGSGLRWRPHRRAELRVDFRLHHSVESVRYDFASAGALASVTPEQAGDRFPELRYRDYVLEHTLRVALMEDAALRLFHRYQNSSVRDFAQRGLAPDFAGRAVVLGHVDDDYEAHVFGVTLQVRF